MALESKFPKFYSVSVQKQMKISDCGLWDGLIWVWNLLWRRELYDWQKKLADQLQDILVHVHLTR